WDNACSGTGGVVLVRGARGSGKTRLVSACAARAREGGRGRALEVYSREGDAPYGTLRRILDAFLASIRRFDAGRAAGEEALRIAAEGPLASVATLIAPALSDVLGQDTAAASASAGFLEGAAEVLVRLARHSGPLLIAVDDLQWTDPASREVLVRVAHRI